jgi:hypothetical protein
MYRILIAGCEQEISSFNPVLSQYGDFEVHQGPDLLTAHTGAETTIRGALDVFRGRPDVQVIPAYAVSACSAGPLSRQGFERLVARLDLPLVARPVPDRQEGDDGGHGQTDQDRPDRVVHLAARRVEQVLDHQVVDEPEPGEHEGHPERRDQNEVPDPHAAREDQCVDPVKEIHDRT